MVLDGHQHFWRYNPQEFEWIDDRMAAIRRDFLPADLQIELDAAGVDGAVAVQARQTLAETQWLLRLAAANDFIRAVVGWVPLASPAIAEILADLCGNRKLKGVRHVIQGEADPLFMRGREFNAGLASLQTFAIAYDLLVFERQLPEAIALVDRHPEQRFVLDHIAKPDIASNNLEPWRRNIVQLAGRPNVYCKISGMVTEAAWSGPNADVLKSGEMWPYFDTVLDAFGPERLMFGSDWPVCLVATGYRNWLGAVRQWCSALSAAEQARIFGETAAEAYGLEITR